jgi:arginine-tRNA-protein transferase
VTEGRAVRAAEVHVVAPPRPCSYLAGRDARSEYRLALDADDARLDALLVRGWRRFGPVYFRPACDGCGECVPLRLPLAQFAPTRRQRRARRKCARLRVSLGAPRVDEERLALHRAWHAWRERARGWEPGDLDAETYFSELAFPHPAARELCFHDGDRLVAVGLCDVTARAWSAVYFFYHPDVARLSPGVAHVVIAAEMARARGIPHLYLGFRVAGCPSMAYKADFRPHELLVGRPALDEEPTWAPSPPPLQGPV